MARGHPFFRPAGSRPRGPGARRRCELGRGHRARHRELLRPRPGSWSGRSSDGAADRPRAWPRGLAARDDIWAESISPAYHAGAVRRGEGRWMTVTSASEIDVVLGELTEWLEANWDPASAARLVAAAGGVGMGPGPLAPGVVRAGPRAPTRFAVSVAVQRYGRPRPGRVARPGWRVRRSSSTARTTRSGGTCGDGHRRRWLLPTVQRAQRRVRPRRAPDARSGRRRLGRQRPEGVDVGRPGRQQGDAGCTHERGRPNTLGSHTS